MRHKLLATAVGQRTFALIFETGDEILERLRAFARAERLAGSHFTAIGACSEVILGYFEWASRQYRPIPVHEQVEVSLIGDIALAPRLRRWRAVEHGPGAIGTGALRPLR
jgi:predicted DNA-binding protein with PD1-like motif